MYLCVYNLFNPSGKSKSFVSSSSNLSLHVLVAVVGQDPDPDTLSVIRAMSIQRTLLAKHYRVPECCPNLESCNKGARAS